MGKKAAFEAIRSELCVLKKTVFCVTGL